MEKRNPNTQSAEISEPNNEREKALAREFSDPDMDFLFESDLEKAVS